MEEWSWQFYLHLLKIFAPKSIGWDFPSCIFHPWSDSHNIWCLTYFHWIDLLHCFQVHQQLDIWGKASVVSCDYNFPSVITYFLSYYCSSLYNVQCPVRVRTVCKIGSGDFTFLIEHSYIVNRFSSDCEMIHSSFFLYLVF